MLNPLLKCLVPLCLLLVTPINGFWWRSTTTEAPPEPAMKQIPLTYFRTYTYQPMAGSPLPFPLMSSTDYITNYAALANNPYFNSIMSVMPPVAAPLTGNDISSGKESLSGHRPSNNYAGIRSFNGGHVTPPTPATSTTTSTTTTPKITPPPTSTTTTTSTSTTTTTPTPTTTAASSTTTTENNADSGPVIKGDLESSQPPFNRKVYTNHFNINYNRPVYPFPEYSIYKSVGGAENVNTNENSAGAMPPYISPTISTPTTNIEFVPCMCPVNLQGLYPSAMPMTGNPANSIFLAQGRTNSEVEVDNTGGGGVDSNGDTETSTIEPVSSKMDDLQAISMDEEDEEDVISNTGGLS